MAVNLLRNSRLFFTTNVDTDGYVNSGADNSYGAVIGISGATWAGGIATFAVPAGVQYLKVGDSVSLALGDTTTVGDTDDYAKMFTVLSIPNANSFTVSMPVAPTNTAVTFTAATGISNAAYYSLDTTKTRYTKATGMTRVYYAASNTTVVTVAVGSTYGMQAASLVHIYGVPSMVPHMYVTAIVGNSFSFIQQGNTTAVPDFTPEELCRHIVVVFQGAHTSNTTKEILVQDGFSFTQSTQTETIQLNEAGPTPLRGHRQFNTAIDPVEFSFTTYMRPSVRGVPPLVTADESVLWNALVSNVPIGDYKGFNYGNIHAYSSVNPAMKNRITITFSQAYTDTNNASLQTLVSSDVQIGSIITLRGLESVTAKSTEWNNPCVITAVRLGTDGTVKAQIDVDFFTAPISLPPLEAEVQASAIRFAKGGWSESPDLALLHLANSDTHRLQEFGLVVLMDNLTYVIDKCVIDKATINFGIDQIASIVWSGKGTRIKQYETAALSAADLNNDATLEGGFVGVVRRANATAQFLANKLTTAILKSNIGGYLGTEYFLPITGGSIDISNNISYLTPSIIGVVNKPIAYFTGSRVITGNFTAYLRSGSTIDGGVSKYNTATLADELYGSNIAGNNTGIPTTSPKFYLELHIGGINATTKVQFDMNAVALQVPKVDSQSVMSIDVSFSAQGSKPDATTSPDFDIENKNELQVRYYSTSLSR